MDILLDCEQLEKNDVPNLGRQSTLDLSNSSSSEQVSLDDIPDDSSDQGYITSPASSPGSVWSSSAHHSPMTMDEDTISSLASLWDDVSGDSLFSSSQEKRKSEEQDLDLRPFKLLKTLSESPCSPHSQVPQIHTESTLRHSQLLLHLAGTKTEDQNIEPSTRCTEISSQSNLKREDTHSIARRASSVKGKPRKDLTLSCSCPSSQNGVELKITDQPERHHRARYLTEGSRGCVKNEAKVAFPAIQLIGWNGPVMLEVFVANDQGKIRPHGYYQACKVTGQNTTPCSEVEQEGTKVIKIPWRPVEGESHVMEMSIDCVGILKLRNADVEHNHGFNRSKKKSTSVRMVFRVTIPTTSGQFTLQAISTNICCTQPLGHPEIIKKSLTECSVDGGEELFLIGKNFISKNCEVKLVEISGTGKTVWCGKCEIDKSLFHSTHILCTIPPYKDVNINRPVEVSLVVSCGGGKQSELMAHPITYKPLPEPIKIEHSPKPQPVPELSNAAVLQFLAVKLSQDQKESAPLLKLSDDLTTPIDLTKNTMQLIQEQQRQQQLQQLQQQQQLQKQLSFEDIMKTAAGLMTTNANPGLSPVQDVRPVQVFSAETETTTSSSGAGAIKTPVLMQQNSTLLGVDDLSRRIILTLPVESSQGPMLSSLPNNTVQINMLSSGLLKPNHEGDLSYPAAVDSIMHSSSVPVNLPSSLDSLSFRPSAQLNQQNAFRDVNEKSLVGCDLEDVLDLLQNIHSNKPLQLLG